MVIMGRAAGPPEKILKWAQYGPQAAWTGARPHEHRPIAPESSIGHLIDLVGDVNPAGCVPVVHWRAIQLRHLFLLSGKREHVKINLHEQYGCANET